MKNSQEFDNNKLYGNIGESIVQFIFDRMNDWKCIRYGIENHIEELKKQLRGNNSAVSRKIRSMPDFIAINEKNNDVMLIEAKYKSWIDRRNPNETIFEFKAKQIERYMTFWNEAKLIIVNNYKPYFIVVNIKDIKKEYRLDGEFAKDEEAVMRGDFFERWDFKDIVKDVRDVFPELTDEIIQKAISMIPKK